MRMREGRREMERKMEKDKNNVPQRETEREK